jgi:hypothetical protein
MPEAKPSIKPPGHFMHDEIKERQRGYEADEQVN